MKIVSWKARAGRWRSVKLAGRNFRPTGLGSSAGPPKRPLVTDSSLAGASRAFAEILAARASVDREIRRKATVRAAAGVLVVIVHIGLFAALVIAITLQPPRRGAPPVEVELVL